MKLTTENTENTERATPETDACISSTRGESIFDLCKKLERERDEAREEAHIWRAKAGFDKYDNFSWEETAK